MKFATTIACSVNRRSIFSLSVYDFDVNGCIASYVLSALLRFTGVSVVLSETHPSNPKRVSLMASLSVTFCIVGMNEYDIGFMIARSFNRRANFCISFRYPF